MLIHVFQSQARYTIGKDEAVDMQRMLNTVGSALRGMRRKNERDLRGGVGRGQTAARCVIGADERAEFDALRRQAANQRELSRREQRRRVRAEMGADAAEELPTPELTELHGAEDDADAADEICDEFTSGADGEPETSRGDEESTSDAHEDPDRSADVADEKQDCTIQF